MILFQIVEWLPKDCVCVCIHTSTHTPTQIISQLAAWIKHSYCKIAELPPLLEIITGNCQAIFFSLCQSYKICDDNLARHSVNVANENASLKPSEKNQAKRYSGLYQRTKSLYVNFPLQTETEGASSAILGNGSSRHKDMIAIV